ncbi:helix-turn-helix domain-containing protein [Brumimicrobium glaciale]|nr:helix-turn-helix transcriptional regulator [Brumimicrobium glaciale]
MIIEETQSFCQPKEKWNDFIIINQHSNPTTSLINDKITIFGGNKRQMSSKKVNLLPKYQQIFDEIGENIKLARKRRKLTTEQVSERAGVHRSTLNRIEKGDPSVAIGIYFNVLKVLSLEGDFKNIAKDDVFGRKLQDLDLL